MLGELILRADYGPFAASLSNHDTRGPAGEDCLVRVLEEIAGMMGTQGACLTLHSTQHHHAPVCLYEERGTGSDEHSTVFGIVSRVDTRNLRDGVCLWREGTVADGVSVLLMPIDQLADHSRLVVSVPFRQPTPERRAAAERIYRERRPFAVGFFHLWQRNRLLERRTLSLELALDRTAIGIVMLNRSGHIVYTNQTADEVLARADGVGRSHGLLRAVNLRDGVNLQAAITHAILSDDPAAGNIPSQTPLIAFHRRTGAPLVAAVLPTAGSTVEPNDVAAIVYMVDPELDTRKLLSPLCRLYGLSPVETALVCNLAAGETLASAAKQMHIKEQTARSYLKTVFIKTGTCRQAELIVLMLSSLIRTKSEMLQEALN